MSAVSPTKFDEAEIGICKVQTPEYIFILNKNTPTSAKLVTVITRSSMTMKNRRDYLNIHDISIDLFKQINMRQVQ